MRPAGPFQIAVAVTPDGRRLLYRERTADGFELLVAPIDDCARPEPLLRPGVSVWDAALSPDGRLLAYVAPQPEGDRPELYLRLLAGAESVRVSEAGAWTGRFAPDGRTLFFTTADRHLASVPVAAEPGLTVGKPTTRFACQGQGWMDFAALPDGRFAALIRETDGTLAPLTVVSGWNRVASGASRWRVPMRLGG